MKVKSKLEKLLESIDNFIFNSAPILSPLLIASGFYLIPKNNILGYTFLLFGSGVVFPYLTRIKKSIKNFEEKKKEIMKLEAFLIKLKDIEINTLNSTVESLLAQSDLIEKLLRILGKKYEYTLLPNPYFILGVKETDDKIDINLAYVKRYSEIFMNAKEKDDEFKVLESFLVLTNAYLQIANIERLKEKIGKKEKYLF